MGNESSDVAASPQVLLGMLQDKSRGHSKHVKTEAHAGGRNNNNATVHDHKGSKQWFVFLHVLLEDYA